MAFYPRLRDLREDADLTQEELVKQLGMHKTTYTNYEQGKREPPFELIIRLAKLYGVSIDYIDRASHTLAPAKIKPHFIPPAGDNSKCYFLGGGVFYV